MQKLFNIEKQVRLEALIEALSTLKREEKKFSFDTKSDRHDIYWMMSEIQKILMNNNDSKYQNLKSIIKFELEVNKTLDIMNIQHGIILTLLVLDEITILATAGWFFLAILFHASLTFSGLGLGLALAAGALIYMYNQYNDDQDLKKLGSLQHIEAKVTGPLLQNVKGIQENLGGCRRKLIQEIIELRIEEKISLSSNSQGDDEEGRRIDAIGSSRQHDLRNGYI